MDGALRQVQERSGTALDRAIVDEELEVPFEHVEVLVLVAMEVGRMALLARLACVLEYRALFASIASSLEGDVHASHQHIGFSLPRSNYSRFRHECRLLFPTWSYVGRSPFAREHDATGTSTA